MILTFADWKLSTQRGASLGHQYDNLTSELIVQGDLPEGWEWDILVSAGGNGDTWHLTLGDGQASITLTEDNLSVSGEYYLQLRGIKGEQVRHTNIVTAYNFRSLSGAGQWPTLPTEWIQAEKDIKELYAHPPVPGEDGYWQLWDLTTHSYQPSQLVVPGLSIQAGTVTTLEPDQPATVQVVGDGPDYRVNFGIPQGKPGKDGAPGKDGTPGKNGTDGAPGQDGQTPTIAVGTVTTLDPGQDATAEITGETPNLVLNMGIPQGQPGQDGAQLNDNAVNITEAWSSKKIVDTLCPAFSVSGNPVTCNPVEGYPLSAVVTLEPKQAGTGDPSPDNVRPISGYDEVTVNVRGKNVFDSSIIPLGNDKGINLSFNAETQTFTMNGTTTLPSAPYFAVYLENLIPTSESMTITVVKDGGSITIPDGGFANAYFGKGDEYGQSKNSFLNATLDGGTRTASNINDKKYLTRFWFFLTNGVVCDELKFKIQVEYGNTPTPYEPYQPGTTAQLSLPETIYGGTVDAVTGVGSKTWGYIASYNGESLPGEWISDRDVYSAGTTPTTGAQVAYKLATPEPFQATGNQALPAVAGLNTVYTDGDSLDVTGRQDLLYTLQTMQAQTQNLNRFIAEGGTQ